MKNEIFDYLDSKLEFIKNRFEVKDSNDAKTSTEMILGGIQWVIHCNFPNLAPADEVSYSQEWTWKSMPLDKVEEIKKKDSQLYNFFVKNYGERI